MPPQQPTVAARKEVRLWQSQLLQHVRHGFTDRYGGASTGSGATLDLKLGPAAARPAVRDNRRRVLAALHCAERVFVAVKQVHEDNIVQVTAQASPHIEADGIWTRDPKVVLAILTADCVPILLVDAACSLVAAVHAGWRGTCSRVAARMVERLQAGANVAPEQLRAVLGPAIGPCCFTVGLDTAMLLRQAYPQAGDAIRTGKSRQVAADLWALNRQALVAAGVASECIDVMRICTACGKDYFSYRRDRGDTGRQAGVIALR